MRHNREDDEATEDKLDERPEAQAAGGLRAPPLSDARAAVAARRPEHALGERDHSKRAEPHRASRRRSRADEHKPDHELNYGNDVHSGRLRPEPAEPHIGFRRDQSDHPDRGYGD